MLSGPTDELLQSCVDKCLRGSIHGFEPIVDHFKRPIFNYVMRTTRNRQDAEDICQEIFLSAFRYLHTYQSQYKFSTWLFTIAHNTVARHLRKKAADDIPLDPGKLDGIRKTHMEGTSTLTELIDLALDTVAPQEREVMVLHYLEGFSYQEIANVMSLTEPQVRMRLYRTRKKIRKIVMRMEHC